jgi:hypothetical protein
MKTRIAALTLLLMAGTAPAALAQDHDHDRPDRPAGAQHEHHGPPPGAEHAQRPAIAAPPAPPVAPQAHAPPAAPQPRPNFAGRPEGRWGGAPPPGVQPPVRPQFQPQARPQPSQAQGRPDHEDGRRFVGRPGRWTDTEGDDTSKGLSPADRADREDRDEQHQWRRYNNDRQGAPPQYQGGGRPDGRTDGHGDGNRDGHGDRHWDGRGDRGPAAHPGDGDRRFGDHSRPNPRWEQQHSGDRAHRDRPQWRPGAFPQSFRSHHRFHVRPYHRPPHFFLHGWGFGEFLPPAWYGPDYLIADWWDYDLPAPPYGFDWVRVGDDALLIDDDTGRIVQAIRGLFW